MNILFVSYMPFNPSFGGIERVTDILSKALIERGHRVFYVSASVEDLDELIFKYNFPAELYALPNKGFFDSQANVAYYKSLLNELSIDIVINQQGINPSQNNILVCNKKTISVIHSNPDCYLQSNILKILESPQTFIDYVKYMAKFLLFPYLRNRIKRIVGAEVSRQYSYICEKSDAVVLLSEKYKDKFMSYIPSNGPKILRGISNPNTYPSSNINFERKEKIILYVGRLSASDKCPMRLLKVWKGLYKKYPEWELIFVGDGPDFHSMSDYIDKYKLKRVTLKGAIENLEDFYKKASMICLTSTFEGWGMSLTEGMQFGCIPLTFNNYEAASDIIDDGINGFLIPAYKLKVYRERLSELMSDEKKRKMMSVSALYKSESFNVEKIVVQWEKLFSII